MSMNEEVDGYFKLTDELPGGWTGAMVDVETAITAHLIKYGVDHPGSALLFKSQGQLNIRYTLDGTHVSQSGSRKMVVVAAVLDLPGLSTQPSEACVPIAFI